MSGAPTPQIIFEPIAADAAPANITSPMPDVPPGGNAASVQQGFPAITMESELAGGKPPLGQDMNGFLNLLSGHAFFLQCGQFWPYSATLATAIGGYNTGAILEMADGTGLWLNTVGGNTSNPDTGGAGWVPLSAYGVTSTSGTGGTLTLSAAQARYPIVIISGALTSNLVVQVPNRLGRWLFVNATTGAFSLTVRTTSNLAGINVPMGGGLASPVEVYCIGDGNIYPTVTPLSVAIDQNPTPSTLAERTNAGYLLATYLNQNSGLENVPIGAIFAEGTAHDGFLRKIPLSTAIAQLAPPSSAANPGYMEFSNGWILNFGFATASPETNVSDINVTFAKPFAIKLLVPGVITRRSVAVNGNAASGSNFVSNESLTGMTITVDVGDPGGPANTAAGYWFALGV